PSGALAGIAGDGDWSAPAQLARESARAAIDARAIMALRIVAGAGGVERVPPPRSDTCLSRETDRSRPDAPSREFPRRSARGRAPSARAHAVLMRLTCALITFSWRSSPPPGSLRRRSLERMETTSFS